MWLESHLLLPYYLLPKKKTLTPHGDLALASRGGARNFGLGGPNCDANILVKTNFYTHMYIN